MNPFEYFLKLKPQIEQNKEIMDNIKAYALSSSGIYEYKGKKIISPPYIGKGIQNTYHRIGKLEDDIWIATREYVYDLELLPNNYRSHYEDYIKKAVISHNNNHRVPKFCGGVCAKVKDEEKYFLILEDLTQGGTADFKPGGSGEESGILNGKEVFHDFETKGRYKEDNEFEYMTKKFMININL